MWLSVASQGFPALCEVSQSQMTVFGAKGDCSLWVEGVHCGVNVFGPLWVFSVLPVLVHYGVMASSFGVIVFNDRSGSLFWGDSVYFWMRVFSIWWRCVLWSCSVLATHVHYGMRVHTEGSMCLVHCGIALSYLRVFSEGRNLPSQDDRVHCHGRMQSVGWRWDLSVLVNRVSIVWGCLSAE